MKAIVFDFGNVVGYFDHRKATQRLGPYSRLAADDLHRLLFGSDLEDRYERGAITTAEFRATAMREAGLTCSEAFFDEAYRDIFWPHRELCELLPELAKRYPLLLLSNTNDLHAGWFAAQFAAEFRHFRHLLYSHEVRARKPEAAAFAAATRLADCRPEEVLFFDDLESNVAGARAFGWQGVVFSCAEDVRRYR